MLASFALPLLLAAAPAPSSHLLIWGGGPTEADASAALTSLRESEKLFADWVQPASGFPKVVKSEDVGLPRGQVLLVLGACAPKDVPSRLNLFQAVFEGVQARKGNLPADSCPVLMHRAKALGGEKVSTPTRTLTVSQVAFEASERIGVPGMASAIVVVVRAKDGALLDAKTYRGFSPFGHGTCSAVVNKPRKGAVVVVVDCKDPDANCSPKRETTTWAFAVGPNERLNVKRDVSEERERCGGEEGDPAPDKPK